MPADLAVRSSLLKTYDPASCLGLLLEYVAIRWSPTVTVSRRSVAVGVVLP
jgi:hypothetical protein